jgi:hypothetical protein
LALDIGGYWPEKGAQLAAIAQHLRSIEATNKYLTAQCMELKRTRDEMIVFEPPKVPAYDDWAALQAECHQVETALGRTDRAADAARTAITREMTQLVETWSATHGR